MMRRLFVVGAKLVGLVQLYWTLLSLVQVGLTLVTVRWVDVVNVEHAFVSFLGAAVFFALSLVIAWVLLFRTKWVADRLRVQDGQEIGDVATHPALLIGVKLIGVYVTVRAIPSLTKVLLESPELWDHQHEWGAILDLRLLRPHLWVRIIPVVLQLALGLCLALNSEKVVNMITSKKTSPEPPTMPDSGSRGGSPQG